MQMNKTVCMSVFQHSNKKSTVTNFEQDNIQKFKPWLSLDVADRLNTSCKHMKSGSQGRESSIVTGSLGAALLPCPPWKPDSQRILAMASDLDLVLDKLLNLARNVGNKQVFIVSSESFEILGLLTHFFDLSVHTVTLRRDDIKHR